MRDWHHPVAISEYLAYDTDIILQVKTKETRLGQNLDETRNNGLGIESKKFTMVKKTKDTKNRIKTTKTFLLCIFPIEK